MPKHQSGRASLSVAVPVLFIDELMPQLKDTELRTLLAVVRQIRVTGMEASYTWLVHAELCRRTGRASAAVSGAVDSLARRGLLEVTDERGRALRTPSERRSADGRRLYRLGSRFAELTIAKAKTIDYTTQKTYCFRNAKTAVPSHAETVVSQAERERIESEKKKIRRLLEQLPRRP